MTASRFQILSALYPDIERLASVYLQAHSDDPLYTHLYNDLSWEAKLKFESSGLKRAFLEQPWVKYHKVVEVDTGKIVAWSRWHFPRPLVEHEKGVMDPDLFDEIPDGSNKSFFQEWFQRLEKLEFKYIDRESGYFLNFLAVLPAYQRLGLGTRLMEIGINEADKDHASVFLVATRKGEGLYKKLGFKEVESLVVDTRLYGGDGEVPYVGMIRKPGGVIGGE